MKDSKKLDFYNYKKATIITLIISSIGLLIAFARVFHIHEILDYLPKASEHLFQLGVKGAHIGDGDGNHSIMSFIYIATCVFNLTAVFLILRKSSLSLKVLQLSILGLLTMIGHRFFIDIGIEVKEAIELIFVFLFYMFLFYHFLHLRSKGWFSLSSKHKTTTTAVLKIQTGCGPNCMFCITPGAQGSSRSDTLLRIKTNAQQIASNGIKEIILKGDNIADFGTGELGDLEHEHTFLEMMQELDKVGEIERFRFSEISTPLISEKTLSFFFNSTRFTPHFDISMKSGSNKILEKMRCTFKREQYENLFLSIKKIMPHAYISVNIIVGTPGETDELFEETYRFLETLDIAYIRIWDYSKNSNTLVNNAPMVPKRIRSQRKKRIKNLSIKKLRSFYENQLGKICEVLFEKGNSQGFIYGYTENYVKVKTAWRPELENSIHKVTLVKIGKDRPVLIDFISDEINKEWGTRI